MGNAHYKSLLGENYHPEEFSLLWLDQSVDSSKENRLVQQQLRSYVEDFRTFDRTDTCLDYIQHEGRKKRIVLIVSGQFGREIVPRIHSLRQIFGIYVYCCNQEKHRQWASEYTKVKDVVVNLDDLIGHIRSDRVRRPISDTDYAFSFRLYRTDPDQTVSKSNHEFIHLQLILRCLSGLPSTHRHDFIEFYRDLYRGNKSELAILDRFVELYSADRALLCYIQEPFIARLLDKALETIHIDQLYLLRFLLSDLRIQFDRYRCTSRICTYRRQLLSKTDFQQIRSAIGGLMSINTFLLTSCQREKLIGSPNETMNSRQPVLFEIDADPQLAGVPSFIRLKSLRLSSDNNEVLFMIGSIFRIDDVSPQFDASTIIRLTLCSFNDIKSNSFHLTFDEAFENGNDVDSIAYSDLLLSIGKLDESEKYYQRALKELNAEKSVELARCYYGLGTIAMNKDKDDLSLDYHQKSLAIRKDLFDDQDASLAESYHGFGDVLRKQGNRAEALDAYNRALNIWRKASAPRWAHKIAVCLNNIGCLYSEEKDFSTTLRYYEEALEMMQKYFPSDHPHLGQTHNNIGSAYRALGHHQNAIQHYQLSLEIKSKVLSSQHLSIASTLSNIAGVYEEIQEFKQALLFYERAAAIYRQRLPPTHADYQRSQTDVRRVSNKLKS